MRIILALVAAIMISSAVDTASAQTYPWCANYGGGRGGGTNCYFATYEQCQWALSGNGGFCTRNLFYDEAHGKRR
ncbi:MAG: DUF3551 domain-containing protein [Proteobacteria bacterium]|nr:DUF3551 domain-containing protein [Pseudomonadota bacterium]